MVGKAPDHEQPASTQSKSVVSDSVGSNKIKDVPSSVAAVAASSQMTAASSPKAEESAVSASSSTNPDLNLGATKTSSGYVLPENCALVKSEEGVVAIVICSPQPEGFWPKLAPNVPSIAIALVAMYLSAKSIAYTRSKDDRARQQSIQDDFWLRKVISPVSIEPFVTFMTKLLAELPEPGITPVTEGKKFCEDKLRELRSLMSAFETIRLIDDKLLKDILPRLENVEDQLAVYFGELTRYWDAGEDAPSRPALVENLTASLTNVLGPIKEHQANVGGSTHQEKWYCKWYSKWLKKVD